MLLKMVAFLLSELSLTNHYIWTNLDQLHDYELMFLSWNVFCY